MLCRPAPRCVAVWLCGCVAVWLCGCVAVWLCGCVCVWHSEHSPIELLPLSRLRSQFATNALGTVSVVRHFTPLLRSSAATDRSSPRLVLLSSITGQFAIPGLGAYCATKYAIEALADSLRAELHHWNIKVALVQPGQTATHFNATVERTGEHLKQLPVEGVASDGDGVRAHYSRAYNRFFHQLLPADDVTSAVDAIELALTDSRPLARYRSGWTSLPTGPFLLMPTEIGDLMLGWWYR